MEELKPCNCKYKHKGKETPLLFSGCFPFDIKYYVACPSCNATHEGLFNTEQEAIDAWNNRV